MMMLRENRPGGPNPQGAPTNLNVRTKPQLDEVASNRFPGLGGARIR
jgi:hypothetical protein